MIDRARHWGGRGSVVRVLTIGAHSFAATLTLGLLAAAAAATPNETAASSSTTLYSVPSQVQYVDNQDDRARGEGHNPFGNYTQPFTASRTSESRYGPFAGDEAIVSYDLFSDGSLTKKAGTAVSVCEFGLGKSSSCDVSFQLAGGSLTGIGSFGYADPTFALSLSGGSSGYRGKTGDVAVAPSQVARAHETAPLFAKPASLLVNAQKLTLNLRTSARGGNHDLDLYSSAIHQQFVNNNDDEARGDLENPFGTREYVQCNGLGRIPKHACITSIINKARAVVDAHSDGPYAGDETVFLFDLYPNASRKSKKGTAVLTCQYAFDKNGFCDVNYQIPGGSLVAAGTFNFDAQRFSLPITGGSGSYRGATGDVQVTPGPHNMQHLAFVLSS